MQHPSLRVQVILAFLAIYTIWGSTYLAIAIAIETIPSFLMAGIRFLVAGGIVYLWTRLRGAPTPTVANWKAATIVGGLLLLGGNGGVVWAEKVVPSGLTAVLITTVPLWMAVLEWKRYEKKRPGIPVVLGLVLGFGGVVLLAGPEQFAGTGSIDRTGAVVLVFASLSWAIGSLYSRKAPLPSSPLQSTGMQMLGGGVLLIGASLVSQEWAGFQSAAVSTRSLVALAYLIVFGALVAYTSYVFLLKATTSAKVSTYAYVNPVIAVALGWAILNEELAPRTILAAAIIVAAVFVITTHKASVNRQLSQVRKLADSETERAQPVKVAPTRTMEIQRE